MLLRLMATNSLLLLNRHLQDWPSCPELGEEIRPTCFYAEFLSNSKEGLSIHWVSARYESHMRNWSVVESAIMGGMQFSQFLYKMSLCWNYYAPTVQVRLTSCWYSDNVLTRSYTTSLLLTLGGNSESKQIISLYRDALDFQLICLFTQWKGTRKPICKALIEKLNASSLTPCIPQLLSSA